MKATAEIVKSTSGRYWGEVIIHHELIDEDHSVLFTVNHESKGQLRRKVIQFCAALNLEVEFI
jgi:hypothetical protein